MTCINGSKRWSQCGSAALLLGYLGTAHATPFDIRQIDFGDGIVASGALVFDDSTHAISDWNLRVTTTTQLAHYTRANAPHAELSSVNVSADGARLSVATSPDSAAGADGGTLGVRGGSVFIPFAARVADFSSTTSTGGEAAYVTPFAFDTLPLAQPDNSVYVAATADPLGSNLFRLNDVLFGGGVTMYGTLTTDGAVGPITALNLVDWNITVDEITTDIFNPSNSSLTALGVGLNADGSQLAVDNSDGVLSFGKLPLGGRLHALTLADFGAGSPFYGTAGYFLGRLAFYTVDLQPRNRPWDVTGPAPIVTPEPGTTALVLVGLGAMLRRHRSTPRAA